MDHEVVMFGSKVRRWVAFAPLLLALAAPAGAQPAPPSAPPLQMDGRHGDGPMHEVFRHLNLSPDQMQRLKALREHHRSANGGLHAKLFEAHRALRRYLVSPDATLEGARDRQRAIDALEAQAAQDRLSAWFELRQVLRPDQLKRLADLDAHAHHPWRHGR